MGVRPVAPPRPNLGDPALYLDFFGQTLDYAVFPHESKHPMALGSDISSKTKAWGWICEQITAGDLHPKWIHRAPLLINRKCSLRTCFAGSVAVGCPPVSALQLPPNCLPVGTPLPTYALRRMVGPSLRMIRRRGSISELPPAMYAAHALI